MGRMSLRERVVSALGGGSLPADELQRLERLHQRVDHLEKVVEGLQDAIHRDSIRHEERMTELERKTDPDELAKALSDDARRRGI
jgi:hypothetical protein